MFPEPQSKLAGKKHFFQHALAAAWEGTIRIMYPPQKESATSFLSQYHDNDRKRRVFRGRGITPYHNFVFLMRFLLNIRDHFFQHLIKRKRTLRGIIKLFSKKK